MRFPMAANSGSVLPIDLRRPECKDRCSSINVTLHIKALPSQAEWHSAFRVY